MSDGTLPAAELDRLGRAVIGTASDAVVYADREGVIRFWNPGAERVFGIPAAEAVGRSLDLIIPERLRARHWRGWDATMKSGITKYADGQLLAVPALHKDGRQVSIEFSLQLVKDPDGRIAWIAAIVRDVTERYIRDRALAKAQGR